MKQEFSRAKNLMNRVRRKKSPSPPRRSKSDTTAQTGLPSSPPEKVVALQTSATMPMVEKKVRMSHALLGLLVYTVGVKCRGFNKKEVYAPEHLFSLSERTASKYIKQSLMDLVKHNKTHLVRIYPNGLRLNSSNYEPHRYWSAGCQLVAINWQTFGAFHSPLLILSTRRGMLTLPCRSWLHDQSCHVPAQRSCGLCSQATGPAHQRQAATG